MFCSFANIHFKILCLDLKNSYSIIKGRIFISVSFLIKCLDYRHTIFTKTKTEAEIVVCLDNYIHIFSSNLGPGIFFSSVAFKDLSENHVESWWTILRNRARLLLKKVFPPLEFMNFDKRGAGYFLSNFWYVDEAARVGRPPKEEQRCGEGKCRKDHGQRQGASDTHLICEGPGHHTSCHGV